MSICPRTEQVKAKAAANTRFGREDLDMIAIMTITINMVLSIRILTSIITSITTTIMNGRHHHHHHHHHHLWNPLCFCSLLRAPPALPSCMSRGRLSKAPLLGRRKKKESCRDHSRACMCVHIYIERESYIYIYKDRERKRKRKRERRDISTWSPLQDLH